MKIYTFVTVIALMFTAACAQQEVKHDAEVKNVSATQFRQIIDEGQGQLIDIRTPNEYAMGHIMGARMINFYSPDFREKLNTLDKSQPVYIYCRSGNRTSQTVGLLEKLGFKEIVNLQRGLIDWQRSGYSLTVG